MKYLFCFIVYSILTYQGAMSQVSPTWIRYYSTYLNNDTIINPRLMNLKKHLITVSGLYSDSTHTISHNFATQYDTSGNLKWINLLNYSWQDYNYFQMTFDDSLFAYLSMYSSDSLGYYNSIVTFDSLGSSFQLDTSHSCAFGIFSHFDSTGFFI